MSVHFDTDPRLPVLSPGSCARAGLARPRPTFFVRLQPGTAIPPRAVLAAELQRVVLRELSGWAQLVILELIFDGSVEWHLDAAVPGLFSDRLELGALDGAPLGLVEPELSEAGLHTRGELLVVRCVDRRGPRRPGLWAALVVAWALAERLGGELVDPGVRPLSGGRRPLPPADARVRVVEHLRIPTARGLGRRRWLTSAGMVRFGLPELELAEVPEGRVERGARVLLGVAQHLIDAAWSPPPSGARRREVLVTLGELHWALGGEAHSIPTTQGRGWTRVGLDVDGVRSWPMRLRLVPPLDRRRWAGVGPWLDAVWVDFFGPTPAPSIELKATGS